MEFKKLRTGFTVIFGILASAVGIKYIITGEPIDQVSGNFIIWLFGVTFGVTGGTKMFEKDSWNRNVLKPQSMKGELKCDEPPREVDKRAEI